MKYIINGAMYNWINKNRNLWFASWVYHMRDYQLASRGGQRIPKRKRANKGVRHGQV